MISNEARGNLAPKNGSSAAPTLDMLRNCFCSKKANLWPFSMNVHIGFDSGSFSFMGCGALLGTA